MGTSATKAKNKYAAKNYDQVKCLVKVGKKEEYREAAKASGMSLNAFIVEAIDEKIERDKIES